MLFLLYLTLQKICREKSKTQLYKLLKTGAKMIFLNY